MTNPGINRETFIQSESFNMIFQTFMFPQCFKVSRSDIDKVSFPDNPSSLTLS